MTTHSTKKLEPRVRRRKKRSSDQTVQVTQMAVKDLSQNSSGDPIKTGFSIVRKSIDPRWQSGGDKPLAQYTEGCLQAPTDKVGSKPR